jgi:GT2 family glycosyltransferase
MFHNKNQTMNAPIVEVIICTHNRANQLMQALHALAVQTMPQERFGIFVVDDASTDNTLAVCQKMEYILPNLRYVGAPRHIGLSSARKLGIEATSAPFLLFTDDDCIPRPDWVEQMVAALHREPIVSGAIVSPHHNFWQLCHNIAQFHPFLISRPSRYTTFIAGANMGFTRQVLKFLQGFETGRIVAEDMELMLRAASSGMKAYFTPRAVVQHNPERTRLSGIILYAAKHAATTILLRRKYKFLLRTPRLLLSPTALLFYSPGIALLTTIRIFMTDPVLLKKYALTAPVIFATKVAWCIGARRGLLSNKES